MQLNNQHQVQNRQDRHIKLNEDEYITQILVVIDVNI